MRSGRGERVLNAHNHQTLGSARKPSPYAQGVSSGPPAPRTSTSGSASRRIH